MDSQSSNTSCRSDMQVEYEPAWRNWVNGRLIRFPNRICRCQTRAEVKISESDDNPHKLYYTCMNKPKCGYFKWWVPDRTDFNNGAVLEGNAAAMVDSHVINTIDINVKEVKSIVKKLMKPGHYKDVLKTMMYCNVVLLAVNAMMLRMHNA